MRLPSHTQLQHQSICHLDQSTPPSDPLQTHCPPQREALSFVLEQHSVPEISTARQMLLEAAWAGEKVHQPP